MKVKLFLLIVMACSFSFCMMAQPITSNYVVTKTYLDNTGNSYLSDIQLFDGLGRPSLSATNGMGMMGKYVYSMTSYDYNGRESELWQPAVGTTTLQVLDRDGMANISMAQYTDTAGYSKTSYDALNRIVSIGGVGEDWNGKNVQKTYNCNAASSVIKYLLNNNGISTSGFWSRGTLNMKETKDEDSCFVQVFSDLEGKKILERRFGDNDTYYVYDSYGRLAYVLQPMYQQSPDLDAYAFHYEYDSKGRCIKKTIPGCDYIQYWYDNSNRLSYVQDGNMRNAGKYRFFLYDQYGRMVIQGLCTTAPTVANAVVNNILSNASNSICNTGYTMSNNPNRGFEQLEIANYFDSYQYLSQGIFADADITLMTVTASIAMGLKTGSITMSDSGVELYEVVRYDNKGREAETLKTMLDGSTQIIKTNYTFTNNPVEITERQVKNNITTKLLHTYTYYTGNDKLHEERISYNDGSSRLVASYEYNNLGQLSKISRLGSAGNTEYTYDIHGWLKDISGTKFSQNMFYVDNYGTPCYNGNISRTEWVADGTLNSYSFYYDKRNQLTNAVSYSGRNQTGTSNRYREVITYDLNGNISALTRYGLRDDGSYSAIDNLTYLYNGNQLMRVSDSIFGPFYNGAFHFSDKNSLGNDYEYDENGNMTKDLNKNISQIQYNSLNLPTKIRFNIITLLMNMFNVTEYIYNSRGEKLSSIYETSFFNQSNQPVSTLDVIDYSGNFIYRNGTLERILMKEGFITINDDIPEYHYYLKDHLGNVRVVVSEDGTIEETNGYYPYGGLTNQSESIIDQPYKYNEKELDRIHGFDMYYYGARWYDAAIGRFSTIDPLAEKYYHVSPYAYCIGNPVKFVDSNGEDVLIWYKDIKGKDKVFRFNGSQAQIPKDAFIKDFVQAYNYMKYTGGGENLRKAVINPKYEIYVSSSIYGQTIYDSGEPQPTVFWESRKGIVFNNGKGHQSPATRLEHEFDHAVDDHDYHGEHVKRQNQIDPQYENAEERRVITGAEARTAKKNHESVRQNHKGKAYETISPISTKPFHE